MKKLAKQKQTLDDVAGLIKDLKSELDLMRNLVWRYYLKHGTEIQGGEVLTPPNYSFSLFKKDSKVSCKVFNHEGFEFTSNYLKIQEQIQKLNE